MTEDRYSRLLDLRPEPRPPTCYALLGLEELSDDADAVRQAANRQLAKLNPLVGTADNDEALALTAEIGEAVKVLTDPARKAAHDKPLYDARWREFEQHRHNVMPGNHPLTEAGRIEWVEMGIALNLPWRDVYRHIDEVAAEVEHDDQAMRPAARLPNVSLEEATMIFRCLSLGLELASEKSPDAYDRLAAAGQRLGLPDGAQEQIRREAGGLGPAQWRLPLPPEASAADREKAVEFAVRGMSLARLLSPADDRRLEEIAIRSGLTAGAARHIIDREIGRTHSIRMGDLDREAATIGNIVPGRPVPGDQWQQIASDGRRRRRRQIIVGALIALVLIVAGIVAFLLIRSPADDPSTGEAMTELTPEERAQRGRESVFHLIADARVARLARTAMGSATSAKDRIAAVTGLDSMAEELGAIEAVGWVARNDLDNSVRLVAIDVLAKSDMPEGWRALVQLTNPGTPSEVADRAIARLAEGRDVHAARMLMTRLGSPDQNAALRAARVLHRMTGLELLGGMPTNEDEYLQYASLVRQWIEADGPPAGDISPELPLVGTVLRLPNTEADPRRARLELQLVRLAAKGDAEAWERVIGLVAEEPSEALCSALAEALIPIRGGESLLAQMQLLGRTDAPRAAALVSNLSAATGHKSPAADIGRGALAGVFYGGAYREFVRATSPDLVKRYPALLAEQTEQHLYKMAVTVLVGMDAAQRDAEVPVLVAEARGRNLAAVSALRFLLRLGLGDSSQLSASQAVAAQGTRQAWFLLVDELPRKERLSKDIETALSTGFRGVIPTWTAYGDTSVERFLAWQFLLRHGLKHAEQLPDEAFLRVRGLPSANLPVVVPAKATPTVAEAATLALRRVARLTPEQREALRKRLPAYVASGDAVSEKLLALLGPAK